MDGLSQSLGTSCQSTPIETAQTHAAIKTAGRMTSMQSRKQKERQLLMSTTASQCTLFDKWIVTRIDAGRMSQQIISKFDNSEDRPLLSSLGVVEGQLNSTAKNMTPGPVCIEEGQDRWSGQSHAERHTAKTWRDVQDRVRRHLGQNSGLLHIERCKVSLRIIPSFSWEV